MCKNLLAFDFSLNSTGHSHIDIEGKIISHGVIVPKVDKTLLKGIFRLQYIENAVSTLINSFDYNDTVIGLEGYSYGSRGNTAYQIGELHGIMRLMFFSAWFNFLVISPKTIKKFATGNGNADKEGMAKAAKDRWNFVAKTTDEVDALCLAMLCKDIVQGKGKWAYEYYPGEKSSLRLTNGSEQIID